MFARKRSARGAARRHAILHARGVRRLNEILELASPVLGNKGQAADPGIVTHGQGPGSLGARGAGRWFLPGARGAGAAQRPPSAPANPADLVEARGGVDPAPSWLCWGSSKLAKTGGGSGLIFIFDRSVLPLKEPSCRALLNFLDAGSISGRSVLHILNVIISSGSGVTQTQISLRNVADLHEYFQCPFS